MKYLFCFIIGLFWGIAIMCLLQINRGLDNEDSKIILSFYKKGE